MPNMYVNLKKRIEISRRESVVMFIHKYCIHVFILQQYSKLSMNIIRRKFK